MPDIDKLFEKAEKYLQKQKFDSALETYLEIYKYEPTDLEVLVTLGDLCLKLNRPAEGLKFQTQLIDQYIKRNDTLKAVATCRKVLKLSPQDVATLGKMAVLLEKSQKNSEALEAFREALEIHRKAGAAAQALDCLQHIVKLDPNNANAHVELAELAARSHQPKVATPAFLRAAQLARQAEQEDRWAELVERAHILDPVDEAASIAAAEVYLKKDRTTDVIPLLEPIVQSKPDDLQVLELLSLAYLHTGDYVKAEPLGWKLYQARPEKIGIVMKLAEGFVQTGRTDRAMKLAEQLRAKLFQQGKRNEFLGIMEKIYEADESNLEVLEALVGLYNEMNKEDGLRRSLTRLFNLNLAAEQYEKAADTLERIIDVDPYGEGHYDRLLNLEGHLDLMLYKNISSRVQPPSAGRAATSGPSAAGAGTLAQPKTESLDDLVIEGEMYYQYQLASKLTETLEKINRLYPGAEDKTPRLHELYNATGFIPKPAPGAGPAPAISGPAPGMPSPARPQPAASPQSLEDLRKISEITANIYRESTPQGVVQVAVNEIGRGLNASRCWGALGSADRAPTLMAEYCAPAASPSDITAAVKLYMTLMPQAATKPDGWLIEDAAHFPILAGVLPDVQKLGIKSLLALPLIDKEMPAGLLLVEQGERLRAWTDSEALLLKAVTTHVVIAVNNTKLRRLVRSLAGSDEETGLLPRSSYLDCLLSEASRAKELSQPLSLCLVEPENPTVLLKALGDAALQRYFQQVSKTLMSTLRSNDIAIRYSPCSIAVLFPDTALPQGGLAVEKLRKVISQIKTDSATGTAFCAVVCDVQLGPNFDAVDGVTEVINRLEAALERAHKEGTKQVLLSRFEG
jgi:tetratricopeptide (TPR) repeat protein/GGDEF domain-containing protein